MWCASSSHGVRFFFLVARGEKRASLQLNTGEHLGRTEGHLGSSAEHLDRQVGHLDQVTQRRSLHSSALTLRQKLYKQKSQ